MYRWHQEALLSSTEEGMAATPSSCPYDYSFGRKLQNRERNIVKLQDDLLSKRHSTTRLRAGQEQHFRDHLAKQKSHSWHEAMALQRDPEAILRPPDRKMPVRLYTNMDNDLWYSDPLRAWFNKDEANTTPWEGVDFIKSGYMVRGKTPPKRVPHNPSSQSEAPSTVVAPVANHGRHDFRHRSPYVLSNQPAGQRRTSKKQHSHWMDFDGLVKEQNQESAKRMQERKLYPDACAGHMPGCRQPPYREMMDDAPTPPSEVKVKSHAAIMANEERRLRGEGLETYAATRTEAKRLKWQMQKGSIGQG